MMPTISHSVLKEFWQACSICHDELDGTIEHGGSVSISQRCFHVFHDKCIRPWLEKKKDDCPNCKLKFFGAWELVPNPEYSQEYNKWKADPENYSLEKAFQERYGSGLSTENATCEEVIKPKSLVGKKPIRKLTTKALWESFREKNAVVQALSEDSTPEEVAKAMREAYNIHDEAIDEFDKRLDKVAEDHVETNHILDTDQFITSYEKKAESLDNKIKAEIKRLRTLRPVPHEKILNLLDIDVRKYVSMFIATRNISDRAASKRRVLEIDRELEDFITSLPEDIQRILRPLEPQEPIIEEPKPPIVPQKKPQAPSTYHTIKQVVFTKKVAITSIALTVIGGAYYGLDLTKAYATAKQPVFFCLQAW